MPRRPPQRLVTPVHYRYRWRAYSPSLVGVRRSWRGFRGTSRRQRCISGPTRTPPEGRSAPRSVLAASSTWRRRTLPLSGGMRLCSHLNCPGVTCATTLCEGGKWSFAPAHATSSHMTCASHAEISVTRRRDPTEWASHAPALPGQSCCV
jgi:hypothetical protein